MDDESTLRNKIKVLDKSLELVRQDIEKPDHGGKSLAEVQVKATELELELQQAKAALAPLLSLKESKADSPIGGKPSSKTPDSPSPNSVFSGYAVIVGVGYDLPVTVQDAAAIHKLLSDPTRCAYPERQTQLLTGDAATRAQVLIALDQLAQKAPPDSTAIVYFSGHGERIERPGQADEYFLIPYGYDLQNLANTCISGVELTAKLQAIRSRKLLVLLDCCFAGGLGEAQAKGLVMKKSPLPLETQSILASGSGRVILGSSRADEESLYYYGKPHSEYTIALLQALCGEGASEKDGYARVMDIALYVSHMVASQTGEKQHPILKISEVKDNFPVAYYAAGKTKALPLPPSLTDVHSLPHSELAHAELSDGYSRVLKKYQANLLEVEMQMSEFIDQRTIPLDLLRTRAGLLAKIKELEGQFRSI